jgi:hypothetical protein
MTVISSPAALRITEVSSKNVIVTITLPGDYSEQAQLQLDATINDTDVARIFRSGELIGDRVPGGTLTGTYAINPVGNGETTIDFVLRYADETLTAQTSIIVTAY